MLRSGARPGDVVAVCGTLGRSAAGLLLLQRGEGAMGHAGAGRGERAGSATAAYASSAWPTTVRPWHRRPAGPRPAAAGVTAMLDVSDGLLRDGSRIAAASGVRLDLSNAALAPDIEALATVVGEDAARECVLAGGEEHSLLATFPAARLPDGWRAIGTVSDGTGITLDGEQQQPRGWDHFRQGPDTDD